MKSYDECLHLLKKRARDTKPIPSESDLPTAAIPNSFSKIPFFRKQQIIRAERVIRPMLGGMGKILTDLMGLNHEGIRVYTSNNEIYLLHAVPDNGTVATKVPLSLRWNVVKEIKITGYKEVGKTMRASGYGSGVFNYVTAMTCIGAAHNMQTYLERVEEEKIGADAPDEVYIGLEELEIMALHGR